MNTTMMTLTEARSLGLKKYMPAVACKNGHISLTYTSNNLCMRCNREKVAAYLRGKSGPTHAMRVVVATGDEAAVTAYATYLAGLRGITIVDQSDKHDKSPLVK